MWTPDDAPRFNKSAQSTRVKQVWADVANEKLARTGDEARAIRAANSAIKGRPGGEPPEQQ
jgi:hypothetical protein